MIRDGASWRRVKQKQRDAAACALVSDSSIRIGTFFSLSGDVDVDMTRDLTPAEQSVVAEAFATGDQRSRSRRVQYCAAGRARARQMLVE